jgi:hypothetical protein
MSGNPALEGKLRQKNHEFEASWVPSLLPSTVYTKRCSAAI